MEGISWTRASGELAHAMPLLACLAVAAKRGLHTPSGRALVWIAVAQFALLLDMVWNWRWLLHDYLAGDAAAHNLYEGRRPVQVLVLGVLAAALALAAGWIIFRLRNLPGVSIAAAGTLLSFGLWCIEVISYHNMDRILYHPAGPIMTVGLIWLVLGAIATLGVCIAWSAGTEAPTGGYAQSRHRAGTQPPRQTR